MLSDIRRNPEYKKILLIINVQLNSDSTLYRYQTVFFSMLECYVLAAI